MVLTVRNNKGFSLIEMMIALVIILFTMLAMFAALATSISVNLGNDIRNAAIKLTNQTAEVLLALPFDRVTTSCGITPDPNTTNYNPAYTYSAGNPCIGTHTEPDGSVINLFTRYPNPVLTVRGYQENYNIIWNVAALNDNLRQITITVSYDYRGEDFTNVAVIYKHKAL